MAGLNLYAGGFGGVKGATAPQYGSAQSYASGASASSAAFGGPFTTPTLSTGQILKPDDGFGLAVWLGVASVAGLVLLRSSLPN